MKKLFLPVALIATIVFSTVFCKKDSNDVEECTVLAQSVVAAASAYSSDQSAANCSTYKDALQAVLDSDCGDATSDEGYQSLLDLLTCE